MTTTMILVGDVRTQSGNLASESVHCTVTSPPYFGLRDYGCDGQIGLEPTPDEYVAELVAVFREVRRVLRSDGTLWLNLGDSYSNQGKWGGATGGKASSGNHGTNGSRDRREFGLPFKQRLMIPARVALALQADGWWLRDEIIWHKPNPMPVSVTDRTTPAHEMLYMFSKSSRYFYDMEAVKEPIAESSKKRYAQNTDAQRGGEKQDAYELAGVTSGSRRPNEIVASLAKRARDTIDAATAHGRPHALSKFEADNAAEPAVLRQPRSVWSIATRPFKGAHFATFPPDLIRPCIKAGCPIGGTVLDPFFGAGTTGLVAAELGRSCYGIELNPAYAAIAAERLSLKRLTPDGSIIGRVPA
jgi:DNA modification methylase